MSYDVNGYGTFSGRTAYQLHLYVRRDQTDTANNRSSYAWALYVEGSGSSYYLSAIPWSVNIGGQTFSGSHTIDMRGTTQLLIATSSTGWFNHDSNGNLSINVYSSMTSSSIFGSASTGTAFYTDQLILAPSAPSTPTITGGSVTQTNFAVSYSRGAGNGQSLYADEVQWATDAAFSNVVWTDTAATGSSSPSGGGGPALTPGTTYYVRARSHSPGGYSGYSGAVAQRTQQLPGAPSTPTVNSGTVTPTDFGVSYTRGASNGGTLAADTVQWATDAGFTSIVWTDTAATGTSDPALSSGPALSPGTAYYVRARANTEVGASAWSGTLNQTTLPSTPPGLTVTASISGLSAVLTLTAPGGVSGVSSYTINRRVQGTTTPVTTSSTPSSPYTVSGLIPGVAYEWEAQAIIGGYASPWSAWLAVTQPSPNTSPGDYFDGSSAAKPDTSYAWAGTSGSSASAASGVDVKGWRTFAAGAAISGGTGSVFRVTGALISAGNHAARAVFFTDCTAAGFQIGTDSAAVGRAAVVPLSDYYASLYVQPSKSQNLAVAVSWYKADGSLISGPTSGTPQGVAAGAVVRLSDKFTSPALAVFATVSAIDVTGTGWSLWHSGDSIQADAAMLSLAALFPYFDGDTLDTTAYGYAWLGTANGSESTRTSLVSALVDPLADPSAPATVTLPRAPAMADSSLTVVGIWRRYWATIPQSEISSWLAVIPTIYVTTGAQAARQVRIRLYENPDNLAPEAFDATTGWVSEQIISYEPPNTTITLDGVSERAWASVNGGAALEADHLLYGSGGTPAVWPVLTCGIAYLISFDAPVDADAGNLSINVELTRRY